MKIIQLQGENFKRMTAFDITPKGNTVILSGENGQGKSSVLDSIVMALGGKTTDVAKLTTKPIKEGQKTASVTVTLDEYVITRTWTEKDTYLEMTNREGLSYKSPQALLDQICGGDLGFDPLAFSRMKPKEQRDTLLDIVKIDMDLEQWERDRKFKYDQRTAIGTQGKAIKGKIDTTPEPPVNIPDEEILISEIVKQLEETRDRNSERKIFSQNIKEWDAEIDEMEKQLEKIKSLRNDESTKLVDLGAFEDTSVLENKLAGAEDTNRMVRQKKERDAALADVAKHDAEYAKLTAELDAMQAEKETALQSAKFPIAGLLFTEDEVTYKGIPFGQCSAAEQLKVSMAIAMAKNPKLRVIRITDGSLLDEKNMEVLREMADKNDFQIWVEKVDSSGTVGIVIRDGEVVVDNSKS